MPGLIALAVAMGIGRFAFTPLLPMMAVDAGLTVARGGWLASANYAGYFVGALLALRLADRPGATLRIGLALVAASTAAMAVTDSVVLWLVLRFIAGVASAWVLVFVSSWGFRRPAAVFSGVGIGIAATGLICLALTALGISSSITWIVLGAVALLGTFVAWPAFSAPPAAAGAAEGGRLAWTPESRRLVICYAAFGFGYIVPATFLPAMAKEVLVDPALFGWSWPVFGAAAAISTLVAGRVRRAFDDRAIWSACHMAMAVGVLLSMPWTPSSPRWTVVSTTLAALLVGGTFMVITMVAFQEARRVAGAGAGKLIAVMTSSFAAGQIAGPLVVSAAGAFTLPLALAATGLLATAFTLRRSP